MFIKNELNQFLREQKPFWQAKAKKQLFFVDFLRSFYVHKPIAD